MQLEVLGVSAKAGTKLNRASGGQGRTVDGRDDLKSEPRERDVKGDGLGSGVGMPACEQEVAIVKHIGRIPRSHELFGGDAKTSTETMDPATMF